MSIEFKTVAPNPQFTEISDLHPADLIAHGKSLRIIDVRQPDEYHGELGHIENAELMVLDTLPEKIQDLSPGEQIVFVCRSGNRSARAAAFAHANGYTNVYNMAGGMLLWNELGYPRK